MIQKIKHFIYIHTSVLILMFVAAVSVLPVVAYSQQPLGGGNASTSNTASSTPNCGALLSGGINNIKDLIDFGTCLITKSVVPLLTALSILLFVYGMIQYFINPASVKEREEAKKYMLWALIGLFVLYSVAGILQIIRNTFGVSGGFTPLLPEVN